VPATTVGIGLAAAVGEERAQAVLVQHRAESVEELDLPGVGEIVDYDADRPRPPLAQAAGHRVGSVPELGHGLEHGLPLLIADPGRVLQDE
jgi:hypothetical protein